MEHAHLVVYFEPTVHQSSTIRDLHFPVFSRTLSFNFRNQTDFPGCIGTLSVKTSPCTGTNMFRIQMNLLLFSIWTTRKLHDFQGYFSRTFQFTSFS